MFTHVSHYQGILAVRMASGEDVAPDYRAIPRAVFLEPEIASVGLSVESAAAAGLDAFEKVVDFATTTRGYELEADFGHLAIVVDRTSRTWSVPPSWRRRFGRHPRDGARDSGPDSGRPRSPR